jgi:hypothetical protein
MRNNFIYVIIILTINSINFFSPFLLAVRSKKDTEVSHFLVFFLTRYVQGKTEWCFN